MIFRIFLISLLLLQSILTWSQTIISDVSSKSKKKFEEAGVLIGKRNYEGAREILLNLIVKEPEFWEAYLRLGNLHRNLGEMKDAALVYEKAIILRPNEIANVNAYAIVSEHYFKSGDYKKANEYVLSLLSFSNLTEKFVSDIKRLKTSIDFSLNAVANPIKIKSEALPDPINQSQLQYFPVISPDEKSLIFTSRSTSDRNSDENIVISYLNQQGKWSDPTSISPKINTNFNEGTCTISADGRTLIFTSCVGRDSQGGCDLYITEKLGDKWATPKNLGTKINTRHWESQPTLSADGRQLFWATDRPGGKGKTDIWFSVKDAKGNWGDATNIGSPINTPFDELSPFIHFNQQDLFFATNGKPGLGGYDLFVSNRLSGQWNEPINLGYPLNDADDQMAMVVNIHNTKGYYSKDQRRDDYTFSKIYSVNLDSLPITLSKANFVKGRVLDEETGKPIKAKVELFDLRKSAMVFQANSDSISGDYLFIINQDGLYGLNVTNEKYLPKSINFEQIGYILNDTLDILLTPIKSGSHFALRNIYFDVDKYELQPESFTELAFLVDFLKRNPKLKVQIEGHTDNSGNSKYNLDLSTKRAKSIYEYLILKGISSHQISYLGLGDTKPFQSNETDSGKSLNRRIEVLIK